MTTQPLTLEQILANPKLSQAIQKEMGITQQEIQKTLYGSLSLKQAKSLIDALEDDDAELLLIRALCLRQAIELDLGNENPLFEALADFDNKTLGLIVQHIAKRDQFKSRKKSTKTETVVEIPCAL